LAWALVSACRREAAAPTAGSPRSADAPASAPATLWRRLYGEPGTLNAVLQTDVPEQLVLQYVSRNLFDLDAKMRLQPGLAEKLEVSPDGLTCTVTMRDEAVWEDGSPVTSGDAVFTIRAIADPATPSPLFKPLFEDLIAADAEGPLVFRARFRKPYAYRSLAFLFPVLPERKFAGGTLASSPQNRAPLSNGPYRLVSWKAQESIELERNPRYWGDPGRFDRIVFRILPDTAVAYRALVRGEVDETLIDAGLKARAAADPQFGACCRVLEFYDLDFNYVALNTRLPFFREPGVRRALTMLLDRGSIVRNLYRGSARVISGPWAPESPAYDSTVEPLPFDPKQAAALLDAEGWRARDRNGFRSRSGKAFDFELLVSAGSEITRQIAQIDATALEAAGIRVRVRPIEWASLVERLDSGSYEAALLSSSGSDPNPDPYSYWHSSQWPPQGLNSGYYRNREADRLMDEARVERDEGKRMALFHRLHRIFRDDAPAVFLFNSTKKYGLARRLRGVESSPIGLFSIWPGPLGWSAAPAAAGSP